MECASPPLSSVIEIMVRVIVLAQDRDSRIPGCGGGKPIRPQEGAGPVSIYLGSIPGTFQLARNSILIPK